MEIRQLEAFAAVYAAGSVTAGARMLDRSQPMVSRQIQDLEHELGFTLFTRTRPQVTLTEQGRQLYEEVRHVLAGLQQLETRSREIAQGEVRPLRLATTYALGACVAPQAIGSAERSEPFFERKMHLDSMPPHRVVRAVEEGDADLGLVSLPVDLGRCQVEKSGQAPCVLALPAAHPLAAHAQVSLGQLGDTTVITLSNRSRLRYRLSTALLGTGPEAHTRRQVETTSSTNAVMLVNAGVGVALVDPFTAHALPLPGVVYKPVDVYVPYLFGLLVHREREPAPDVARVLNGLWAYIMETIPDVTENGPDGLSRTRA
ncbi:MAG: LysR family transcriptional regulator [Alcaligenaceae bacterium]|nr:LysR family transcriptional regulator [Alcaligenaceae bacterium]